MEEQLKEKLFTKKENGWKNIDEAKKQEKILTLHLKNAILFSCLRQR